MPKRGSQPLIHPDQQKQGIYLCLAKGKRFLDHANKLAKDGGQESAIPLLVLGFEEINKAGFIENKYRRNESISDAEWGALTKGGSHTYKLVSQYSSIIMEQANMPSENRKAVIQYYKERGQLWWDPEADPNSAGLKYLVQLLPKLNELKKLFLYTEYKNGQWQHNKYRKKLLNALCYFIYHEARLFYLSIKFLMAMDDIGLYPQPLTTREEKDRLFNHPANIELDDAFKDIKTAEWKTAYKIALDFIRSL